MSAKSGRVSSLAHLLFIPVLVSLAIGCAAGSEVAEPVIDPLGDYRVLKLRRASSQDELETLARRNRELGRMMREGATGEASFHSEASDQTVPAPGEAEQEADLDRFQVTGSQVAPEDIITNVQVAGVDEGGIFKRMGDVLIVLRGDHLYSVLIGDQHGETLRLVDSYRLAESDRSTFVWYDELLAVEGGLLVLSYDFDQHLSELHVFTLSESGELERSGGIQIQSEDYYSGSNYGMRLNGEHVLLPVSIDMDGGSNAVWPMWRAYSDQESGGWRSLIEPEDVLLPLAPVYRPHVHSVLRCPLGALLDSRLDCRTTGLVSEAYSEMYVSRDAAYVAVDSWHDEAFLEPGFEPWSWSWSWSSKGRSHPWRQTLVYRIPHDSDEQPGVIAIDGSVGNQFSFQEVDGQLLAVTEVVDRDDQRYLEAHRIAVTDFSEYLPGQVDTFARVPVRHSHRTIRITDDFILIGEHVDMLRDGKETGLETEFIIQSNAGGTPSRLRIGQSVDRIEPLGSRVFLSGQSGEREWRQLLLDPSGSRAGRSLAVTGYESAEDRSHAFNWREHDDGSLLLGLPGTPAAGMNGDHLDRWYRIADLLFFTADELSLQFAGFVDMQTSRAPGESCIDTETCWDWYGNSRIAFIGERVLTLSANRLAEARLEGGKLKKLRMIELEAESRSP